MSSRAPNFLTIRLAGAVCICLALAGCSSKQDRIASGLRKGGDFVQLADWDKAGVEVRNVLQIDPKNAQAYLLAARVAEGQRNVQAAYGSYLKALELKPDLLEAKLGAARLLLFAGETEKARAMAAEVLAADAQNVGARTLRAALLARDGKPAEARTEARAVIDSQKEPPVEASLVLAGLLSGDGQAVEALAVVDRALKANPRDTNLLQVAATIATSAGGATSAQAPEYFRRAVKETPKNADLWRSWAALHVQRGEAEQVEAVLRESAKAVPDDTRRTLDLIDYVSQRRGPTAAETEARNAIAARPRESALRFALVNLYRGARRHADAERELAAIVEQAADASSVAEARSQLAGYRLLLGDAAGARLLVAESLKGNPRDNGALLLRGRMHLMEGHPADAVADLRAVVRDQPGSVQAVALLAQAHALGGDKALAREALVDAVKFRPEDPDLRALLAADMLAARDWAGALNELDSGLRRSPQAVRLYELKAQAALGKGDTALAEQTWKAVQAALPQSALGHLRLGQLHLQQRRFDLALKAYDAGAAVAPGDPTPYVAAVGLLVGTKRHDEALARIRQRQQADAINPLHDQLAGDVAVARGDLAAAEKAYRHAIEIAPTVAVGHVNTARVLMMRNDIDGALAVLVAGEKAAPDEMAIPLARAEWLTRARRHEEAIAAYEKLLQRMPEDASVVNNLAYLLAEVKSDRVSTERALALASRFADSRNPSQLDSLGWIHYRLGQYDKAVPLLERAVALAPHAPLLNLHLGKSLVKSGDAARGRVFLKKAIDSRADLPNLDEARAMLAQG